MSDLFRIGDSLKLLRDAVLPVCGTVFVSSRPKHVRERMDEFAVVSLPVRITNRTVGNCGMTSTTCRVDVYVRDRDGQENIPRLDELVKNVTELFPITGEGMTASNPNVVMEGSDGNGFHAASVQADFETY